MSVGPVECPICKQEIIVTSRSVGKTVHCPVCEEMFLCPVIPFPEIPLKKFASAPFLGFFISPKRTE